MFYPEDRTARSRTHIPTARLGLLLLLLWSLSPWEQENNTADAQICSSGSDVRVSEGRPKATALKSPESWSVPEPKAARVTVKLSEGLTTSTALCLIRSAVFKDVPDKVVTRSFCTVNPSRAGSNYRLQ